MNYFYKKSFFFFTVLLFFTSLINSANALAWYDETHLAVAKVTGYSKWYNAAGPDMAKLKADFVERNNHHFNNNSDLEITPETVLAQVLRYNSPSDSEGHLYGAIIASLRDYKKTLEAGKYTEYHIAFCAHYIGDLSQPFHSTAYDAFNKSRHGSNDGVVEDEVLKNINLIEKHMYPVALSPDNFEEDLAKRIAVVANHSRALIHKLRKENRDMTKEEAYIQLGHSASLLKAVLKHLGKI